MSQSKTHKERAMLHDLLAIYIELLNSDHGPESQAATSFVQEHSHNMRFIRCASIAAFYWSTRH